MRRFNFQRKDDHTYLMWNVVDEARPLPAKDGAELVQQMEANGIWGPWSDSVLTQLGEGNTAAIEVPDLGSFRQR